MAVLADRLAAISVLSSRSLYPTLHPGRLPDRSRAALSPTLAPVDAPYYSGTLVVLLSWLPIPARKSISPGLGDAEALFLANVLAHPGLEENTLLLVNDLPVTFYSDNSLTAPLNWIYAPENHSDRMSYLLYYPSVRLEGGLTSLPKGQKIEQDYLAANFHGSTAQIVAVFYEPPACLRVLDAQVDAFNRMLPPAIRSAALLSSPAHILPQEAGAVLPAHLYGAEPIHSWCYYFSRADLARQQGSWEKVAALGDQALSLGDYPNDPSERMPFIEGYAHTGQWARALQQTEEAAEITPLMQVPLCRLWKRIAETTPMSPEKEAALAAAYDHLSCSF
jgi:hypothetical protein